MTKIRISLTVSGDTVFDAYRMDGYREKVPSLGEPTAHMVLEIPIKDEDAEAAKSLFAGEEGLKPLNPTIEIVPEESPHST